MNASSGTAVTIPEASGISGGHRHPEERRGGYQRDVWSTLIAVKGFLCDCLVPVVVVDEVKTYMCSIQQRALFARIFGQSKNRLSCFQQVNSVTPMFLLVVFHGKLVRNQLVTVHFLNSEFGVFTTTGCCGN